MSDHFDRPMFPWGRAPRFYPPGQHPAIRRLEAQRRRLELFAAISPESVDEALAWTLQRIADFEGIESELKARAFYEELEER